jgi:hypothetical protein
MDLRSINGVDLYLNKGERSRQSRVSPGKDEGKKNEELHFLYKEKKASSGIISDCSMDVSGLDRL